MMAEKKRVLWLYGDRYVPLVVKVASLRDDGRPYELEALYDEDSAEIMGGERFLIVYAMEVCLKKTKEGDGS
jgi:hypothetical protein